MTGTDSDVSELTPEQYQVLELLHEAPRDKAALAQELGIAEDSAKGRIERARKTLGRDAIEYVATGPTEGYYELADAVAEQIEGGVQPEPDSNNAPTRPDFDDVEVAEDDPNPNDLTERERYIVRQLQTGVTVGDLAEDLDEREEIVLQYLKELRSDGWRVYFDSEAEHVAIEGDDHALRSSEHTGTRTRKANRWWERRHNQLVRDFEALDRPTADLSDTSGDEDWIHVLGDVHAGDEVFTPGPDRKNVYGIDTVPRIVRYDTRKSLELAEYHGADYGTAHLLWNGDFVTNEGVYTGQFEDLDAWLDKQHDMLMEPLLEQIKAYSHRFGTVNVVCQVGNHGKSRASGTSRQANADLILYKSIRNAIAAVRKYGEGTAFGNVNFQIGQARPYVNFPIRGGTLRGHLRHGQDRKPQATTRAGSDEWKTTLLNHKFDLAFINHHHVSGGIAWDGPPVIVSGTPKPPSDFVDRIAGSVSLDPTERVREISQCVSVADHGLTSKLPIKTHDFNYLADA